jgi:hypothetical protein
LTAIIDRAHAPARRRTARRGRRSPQNRIFRSRSAARCHRPSAGSAPTPRSCDRGCSGRRVGRGRSSCTSDTDDECKPRAFGPHQSDDAVATDVLTGRDPREPAGCRASVNANLMRSPSRREPPRPYLGCHAPSSPPGAPCASLRIRAPTFLLRFHLGHSIRNASTGVDQA